MFRLTIQNNGLNDSNFINMYNSLLFFYPFPALTTVLHADCSSVSGSILSDVVQLSDFLSHVFHYSISTNDHNISSSTLCVICFLDSYSLSFYLYISYTNTIMC